MINFRLLRLAGWCALLLSAGLIVCAPSRAVGAWIDQRAFGPMVCYAEFPLTGYEPLFGDLAQIQADLVRMLHIPPATERIELYLFSDRSSYQRFLARQFPNVPVRQALYVKSGGRGRVLAFRGQDFQIDVRHECTHALLHAVLPMVPLWLDEGLAKYFEVPAADRATRNPYASTVTWRMRYGRVPQLTALESKRTLQEMGSDEYRDSWAYAHFLLCGPPAARAELVRYLADIRSGTPPGQLSDRLRRNFPDLQAALVAHFKSLGH